MVMLLGSYESVGFAHGLGTSLAFPLPWSLILAEPYGTAVPGLYLCQ